ncbi:uncharacterized protein TRUGW13939_02037 [Talaromyces rugulosus]|uniref:Uncharacterized protein n=1 Tax=Talaromyces rugulosus TaxID=121627 RepID=A0A7H8QLY3_TALRU|nr:uncharacterized protein TRUGW13939_02037 [Talaromyces rugulosus]QKX54947.1 hypothetical protein TRUGW13939_02037 [Talaromyces rugulosus]
MEQYIQEVADVSWQVFTQCVTESEGAVATLDMSQFTQAFAFDVLGEVGFGGSFDLVRTRGQGKGNAIVHAVGLSFLALANLGYIPGQSRWLKSKAFITLCRLAGIDLSKLQQLFKTTQYSEELILGRQQEARRTRTDLLQQFIDARTREGKPLVHQELLGEVVSLLGAGADTTAIGIRAALGPLILHRTASCKVAEEIDRFYVANIPNGGSDREITYRECLTLPYLQAVIKEGLRMHPSIQFQLPRYVPTGGVTIRGTYIPEGTEVSMSPVASNRDTAIFGEDAHIWDPDRWLVDKERAARMDKHLATVCYDAPSYQNH